MANNVSYKSNSSSEISSNELVSFDLNSLKPEWIVDNFSDSDLEVHSVRSYKYSIFVFIFNLYII